jgi:hypothetical protein
MHFSGRKTLMEHLPLTVERIQERPRLGVFFWFFEYFYWRILYE